MSTHEEATPFVGDITAHWCPHCVKTTLNKAPIYILTSTGPRRIGEWAVCEDCGYTPYAEGGRVIPRDHGDDIPVRLEPQDAATELTRHDQHHGHYKETPDE